MDKGVSKVKKMGRRGKKLGVWLKNGMSKKKLRVTEMGKSEKKLAVWLEMGINDTGVTEKCIENWSTWQETWVELSSNGKSYFL